MMASYDQSASETDLSLLLQAELKALFHVSQVLSRSLNLHETLQGVLQVLHDLSGMRQGMVTLVDPERGDLLLSAVHRDKNNEEKQPEIRYRPGEGVVGAILEFGKTVVVQSIANEPRFLGRLGLYNPELPFIGVPIRVGDQLVGVLAAQPQERNLLQERARFTEMVANLIGQAVRLSWEVEQERRDLADERDRLRRQVRGTFGFSNIVGHTTKMRRIFEQVRQVAKWNTTVPMLFTSIHPGPTDHL